MSEEQKQQTGPPQPKLPTATLTISVSPENGLQMSGPDNPILCMRMLLDGMEVMLQAMAKQEVQKSKIIQVGAGVMPRLTPRNGGGRG